LIGHFSQLLRHEIVVEIPATGSASAWGHAPTGFTDGATVRGLIQERTGQEYVGPELGGTVVSDGIVFLPMSSGVTERNQLRRKDTGARYRVLLVRDAAGQGHHLEAVVQALRAGNVTIPPVG
jgi:hypothetical protein